MSETANLKLISPDASSVLIPLHSHFAVLASGVDQAITDRFQYKILSYQTENDLKTKDYVEATGLPVDINSAKPPLVDGDVGYVRQNKRYYIWNVNSSGTNSWIQTSKRFIFSNIANRDLMLAEDIAIGDNCYVTDIGVEYVWNGSSWDGGAWKSWTPTVTGTLTLGSGGSASYAFSKQGKTITVRGKIIFGTGGTMSSATLSLPVNAISAYSASNDGGGMLTASKSGSLYAGVVRISNGTTLIPSSYTAAGLGAIATISASSFNANAFASGDYISFSATYEAA
jgi:hypothetical protein